MIGEILRVCLILISLFPTMAFSSGFDKIESPENSGNDNLEMIFDGEGTLWMSWSSFQGGRSRLAVCSRANRKRTRIEYPDSSEGDQLNPELAVGVDNTLHVIYTSLHGKSSSIKLVAERKRSWGNPKVLGEGHHPSIDACSGRIWMAWEDNGRIDVSSFDSHNDGKNPTNVTITSSDYPPAYLTHPRLAGNHDGITWLAWEASQLGYQSIHIRRLDKKNSPAITVDEGLGINRNPRISMNKESRLCSSMKLSQCKIVLRKSSKTKQEKPFIISTATMKY